MSSGHFLLKTIEKLEAKEWIKGTLEGDTFQGKAIPSLDQIQIEADRIGVFRENIQQQINVLNSLVIQIKQKIHRPVENPHTFQQDFKHDLDEITNQLTDIQTQLENELKSYNFYNAKNSFGDILATWGNTERRIHLDLEKMKFTVLWKVRDQTQEIPK